MRDRFELFWILAASTFAAWFERVPRRGDLGVCGEKLAARYLRRRGYLILEMRARDRTGEADIVCLRGSALIFVEVKTRRSRVRGIPELSVDRVKRERLTRFATRYALRHELREWRVRFDVIAIDWPERGGPDLRHHLNAFEAEDSN